MLVETLTGPGTECHEYVAGKPTGRIEYLPAWSAMIANLFGHQSYYLLARGDGVQGILPLVQTRSRLFGNRMVSQALSSYGGIIADNDAARDALFARATELAQANGCESIEFRNIDPLPYELESFGDKVTMFISLEDGADEVWRNVRPEIRKQTRKAEKNGLTAAEGQGELLDDFYRIYARRMHELGTPAFSRKLMIAMLDTFRDNIMLFTVKLDEVTVAAGLVKYFNGIAEVYWSATLGQYNRLYPNRLLYWTMVQHYCRQGARLFDFGRSSLDSGNYDFKRRWRAEPVSLNYQSWSPAGRKATMINPKNPRFQKKVALWKRLPLWTANLMSPPISKHLV